MKTIAKFLVLVLAFSLAHGPARAAQVGNLQCSYAQNPLGIDDTQPGLSWIITSQQRGDKQTAYQILVSSSPELLSANKGDLWDSGKVMSEQRPVLSPRRDSRQHDGDRVHSDLRSKLRHGIGHGGFACTRSAFSSERRQCRRLSSRFRDLRFYGEPST